MDSTTDVEVQEITDNVWDSTINVCPGSSPTLTFSEHGVQEEVKEDKENKESPTKSSADLINWGSDSPWPDLIIPGTWGTHALEEHPWQDKKKPYTNFRKYKNLELNEVEGQGVLTDRIIAACSSYLDKSPETEKYVLCKVNLCNKNLTDITIIKYHHYLQYVDLANNQLTNVEVLGQLPFLMYLNVSHNSLTKVLDFKAPFNLTFVNYSHNDIYKIDDLTDFWSIVHLDLSHNHIKIIEGLQTLQYLRHLNLSHNAIECVENLNHMRLLTLFLQHNHIIAFEEGDDVGFKTLIDILRIDLGYNHLKTLKLFEGICGIQSINIVENSIHDIMEITHLRDLNFLTEVDFRGNPIVNTKFYFDVCVTIIKHLYVLDGEYVDATKKVLVDNSCNPSPHMQAIKKSCKIFLLQQLNDPYLGPSIVPIDQPPPPIIVLVGPPGSNKAKLIQLFCEQHQRFTILGVSHTTRKQNEDEIEGVSYYFVDSSTFRTMMLNGEFLTVSQTLGQYFGLAQSEIGKTVNESRALVFHTNLSGGLTLRTRGLRCHLVLAMTSTVDIHRQWMYEKYYNWHETNRFVGVVEVENCPEQAQRFVSDCDKNRKLEIKEMARSIATEIVYDAMQTVDGVNESRSQINDDYDDDSTSENSVDSVKISRSSSRTSGILKTTSRNKTVDPSHARTSVTFQNNDDLLIGESSQSQVHLQSSRSVTFGDIHNWPSTQFPLSKYSISGTVVRDHEHDSSVNLSAISECKRDSAQAYSIIWDIQTEALKTAVEEIIDTRDSYLDVHYSNPGLFTEVIFTDNFPESLEKLKNLLKKCINSQKNAKPNYQYPTDEVYHKMVKNRLESLHKEINSELSITQKQLNSIDKPHPIKSKEKKSKKAKEDKKPQVGFKKSEDFP